MTILALVISLAVAALGAFGMAAPARLIALVRSMQSRNGLLGAAAIRIVYGISLYGAGPSSASPQAIRALGVFVIVAGILTPLFGVDRFRVLLDRIEESGPGLTRVWMAAAFFVGLGIASQLRP
ncbi:MAG: hypothetical protein QF410_11240 [Planctomycetota bacterium]|jgi:hypothetical protein|nr:hypothetical protein [Planctomycetota bacterium]